MVPGVACLRSRRRGRASSWLLRPLSPAINLKSFRPRPSGDARQSESPLLPLPAGDLALRPVSLQCRPSIPGIRRPGSRGRDKKKKKKKERPAAPPHSLRSSVVPASTQRYQIHHYTSDPWWCSATFSSAPTPAPGFSASRCRDATTSIPAAAFIGLQHFLLPVLQDIYITSRSFRVFEHCSSFVAFFFRHLVRSSAGPAFSGWSRATRTHAHHWRPTNHSLLGAISSDLQENPNKLVWSGACFPWSAVLSSDIHVSAALRPVSRFDLPLTGDHRWSRGR